MILRRTTPRRLRRLLLAGAVATGATIAAAAPGAPGDESTVVAQGADCAPDAGGEYHPVTPTRIFNTKPGQAVNDVAPRGPKPIGGSFTVPVAGRAGIPRTGVLAVALNVTVSQVPGVGNLSIRPSGSTPGAQRSSLVNFDPTGATANTGIVALGADGAVLIELRGSQRGTANVAIDVVGWVSASSSGAEGGSRVVTVPSGRVLDTRTGPVPAGRSTGPLGPGQSIRLPIRGVDARKPTVTDIVPNDPNVTGVILNLTAVNREPTSTFTYLAVTPDRVPAGTRPSTSSGNYPPGTTRANFVVAPVSDDGAIHIYNNRGRIQVIADVVGYITGGLPEASCTGRVVPLELAFRAFDTRQREFGSTPLSHGSAEDWSFENFKESVTIGGAPVGELSGVFGNLTGVGLKRLFPCCAVNTFIAMYPGNLTSRPNVSNVNLGEGKAVPNMSLLTFGTSGDDDYVVTAYNNFGSVHYLLDVYAIVLD